MFTQAQRNHQQVVIEQLLQSIDQMTVEWNGMSKKEKVMAWAEHECTPAHMRPFERFHRVIEVVEELH